MYTYDKLFIIILASAYCIVPDGQATTVILFVFAVLFTTSIPCQTFGLTQTNLFDFGSILSRLQFLNFKLPPQEDSHVGCM